jgi:hypothetical protein
MNIFALIIASLFLITSVSADIIKMKNGDVYRASVLKQEFGNYVQIQLKDGSEKRLPAVDIESIESEIDKTPELSAAKTPSNEIVPKKDDSEDFPSQMLNERDQARFEFDLTGMSYDTIWQKVALQADGTNTQITANTTNRYVRTAPMEFTLGAYLGRWHTYLNFMDSPVNSNDINDSGFSTLAIGYGVSKNIDLGLFFNFNYNNSSQNSSSSSASTTGSSYGFGPHLRVVAPLSDSVVFESTIEAGLSFRNLTVQDSSFSISGGDTSFIATARLGLSVSIIRQVSYLFWVDGFTVIGTLSGTDIVNNQAFSGSLQDDIYRLRVVPIGLRLKF